jgi:hypothetical protein
MRHHHVHSQTAEHQKDRELQEVSATSEAFPAGRYALNLSAYPLDPTVRQWFEMNGLPLDASGSVEM